MSAANLESENHDTTAAPVNDQPPRVVRKRGRPPSSSTPRVDVYAVQCNDCEMWRDVPQENYEEIRERLLQRPFVCEQGREWGRDMSCTQPNDVTEDDKSTVWAIDSPDIPRPPPGWKRILSFRSEPDSKFADVYYMTPDNKRLRSMADVRKHLDENPKEDGVDISRFSFKIPSKPKGKHVLTKPKEKYARERSGADDADWIPEPGETSGVNWSPISVETRAAKRKRESSNRQE